MPRARIPGLEAASTTGKTALVRVDFNVPMQGEQVTDDARLRAALPTIEALRAAEARIVLLSHRGRPKGERDPALSLEPVVASLSSLLGQSVRFAPDCIGQAAQEAVKSLGAGEVLLLENLRFHAGEEANDPAFAAALARLGDLYVADAFSAVHRAHASTDALPRRMSACAGWALESELAALDRYLADPPVPVTALVGGAKIKGKLELLDSLSARAQRLVIGGGMANTFLFARDVEVGASLCEKDLAGEARSVMAAADRRGCEVLLPIDARIDAGSGEAAVRELPGVGAGESILDIGPETVALIEGVLSATRTLLWNGPLGLFERPPFDAGTLAVARSAARMAREFGMVAVAGGGDTAAALNAAGALSDFTFVSNGGGAFLGWLEGKTLPGLAALEAARAP